MASHAWQQFWFEPASPVRLAICRIVFFGLLFLITAPQRHAALCEISPVFWVRRGLFGTLRIGLPPAPRVAFLEICWKASLLFACVGLFSPVTMGVAFFLGYYLKGLPTNLASPPSMQHFAFAPMVVMLAGFAFSDAGAVLSLDARLYSLPPPPASGEYTWPLRLGQVALTLMFSCAGAAKLIASGPRWFWSDNLSNMLSLREANYIDGLVEGSSPVLRGIPTWLARKRVLCRLLGLGTAGVELGYPLALFSETARMALVPAGAMLMLGFWLVLGVRVLTVTFAYQAFWIPWDRVLAWAQVRATM